MGSKKIKDKFSVKKKITPDVYWKQTGQDRVPSLDELEKIPTTGGKDLSKVGLMVGRYPFSKENTVPTFKSTHSVTPGARPTVSKERKKRLKKSKKEKREKKREKKKKEKKKSKDKSHRKKNKHKQNNVSKIVVKAVPQVSQESKNIQSAEENLSVDVVSTDKPSSEDVKTAPKLESSKVHLSKEAKHSNVYFVSESTRPKFESMFGDRQGFVFEKKKKVCAAKEKEKGKTLIDFGEHDPYSLEAEFPSVKQKEPIAIEAEKLKYKIETFEDTMKHGGKLADSIKITNSPDSLKGKGMKPATNNSTSPLSMSQIPPTSVPSVLDSPISLSSTQSTSSTGNIPATSSSSQLSPVHQRLSSLPTPSSCGEEDVQQPQDTNNMKEDQSFDDGDVNDLMDIIENDLATSSSGKIRIQSPPSGMPLNRDLLGKTIPEREQSERDADQKVEEILRAIRESSGQKCGSQTDVKPFPVRKDSSTKDLSHSPRKKPRSRSKSVDKPSSTKKISKSRKSHLASLLQRPGRLNLAGGEVPFYVDGNFPSGHHVSGAGTPQGLPCGGTPSPVGLPSDRASLGNDPSQKGSLLVEMLNSFSSQQENKKITAAATAPPTKPHKVSSPFEGTNLKRPTNLSFPSRQLSPPAFPSKEAPVLMELVRPSIPQAVTPNQPSPVVSPQYNLNTGNFPNQMPLDALQYLPRHQAPQVPSNIPTQRLSLWMNQEQLIPGNQAVHSLNPPPKVPFRFPARFQPPVSTPQRLPPMQALLRGLQTPVLPKSPPSPALPVGPLSPKITHYQLSAAAGGFAFQQPPTSDIPSPQNRPVTPQLTAQIKEDAVNANQCQTTTKTQNPWYWTVPEVMQFLYDAGEGACADTFYRQVRKAQCCYEVWEGMGRDALCD